MYGNLMDELTKGTHKIPKYFEMKDVSEYHDLFVQSNKFWLAEKFSEYVSENI